MNPGEVAQPFAAPAEPRLEASRAGSVVLHWILSGAALGLAGGLTLHLTVWRGATMPTALAAMAVTFVASLVALRVERGHAAGRPPVVTASGELKVPLHGALRLFPLALSLPALLWLTIVASLAVRTAVPALVFGALVIVAAVATSRAWAGHRLVYALERLATGEAEEARRVFQGLEGGLLTPARARDAARLNLGALALGRGDLDAAQTWFGQVRGPAGRGRALAGTALILVIHGELERASEAVLQAAAAGGRAVQAELDLVRVLLVLKQRGPGEALELGGRLLSPPSSALSRAVLARLRALASGAPSGPDPDTDEVLRTSGLLDRVPELRRATEAR